MTTAGLPFDEPVSPSMPLARFVAQGFDARFNPISAVRGGVEDVPGAVDRAQVAGSQGRQKVAFVGEGRRSAKAVGSFKSQQLGTSIAQIIGLPSLSSGASRG